MGEGSHSMAGLQFNKTGFEQKSCNTGDQLHRDPSPSGECSMVVLNFIFNFMPSPIALNTQYGPTLTSFPLFLVF